MAIRKNHLAEMPIPAGMQIYEKCVAVAGISYRKEAAYSFIRNSVQRLDLEPEPTNERDPNAIKVFGSYSTGRREHRVMLGYVPAPIAAQIAASGFAGQLVPRLLHTVRTDYDWVLVEFQLLGPRGRKQEYLAAGPADADDDVDRDEDEDATPAKARPRKRSCLGRVLWGAFIAFCALVVLGLLSKAYGAG